MSQKPPLILIHGFRGAPLGLDGIAKLLRQAGYDVHVPAIPPYAGAPSLETYTPESYAEFIDQYITKHSLERPVLIGHSMGSVIATATAALRPELVSEKLILLAPISTKPAPFFRHLAPLSSLLPLGLVDYVTTKFLYVKQPDPQLLSQIMTKTHQCSHLNPPRRRDSLAAAKFSTDYCVADFHPKQSIYLIVGDHDALIKRAATEHLAQTWYAKLTLLPSSGHLHTYEQPVATAQAILDALKPAQSS